MNKTLIYVLIAVVLLAVGRVCVAVDERAAARLYRD
jgi:type IV secretory pathway VirB3-like protein